MPISKFAHVVSLSFLAFALFLGLVARSEARPYVLLPDGTGDFPTIQAAIDGATEGDIIVLQDGVYRGEGNRNIVFGGKAVTVTSVRGASACIIDCDGLGQGFVFDHLDGTGAILNGITIRNALGYGISYSDPGGDPTLIGCVVESSTHGILLGGESVVIGCVARNNEGTGISQTVGANGAHIIGAVSEGNGGMGVRCAGNGIFVGCEVRSNNRGVVVVDAFPYLVSCVVTGNAGVNSGGGIVVDDGTCRLWNSTVAGNAANSPGGGIWIGEMGGVHMRDSIVWGNHAPAAGGEIWVQPSGRLEILCSDVDTTGVDGGAYQLVDPNVFTDPRFCEPAPWDEAPTTEGDYHVSSNSPCLPESSPCGRPIGALGEGCEAPPASVDPTASGSSLWIAPPRPNPASQEIEFEIDAPAGTILRLEVIDATGRILAVVPMDDGDGRQVVRWDGRQAPAGAYFLRAVGAGIERARRFVLVR